jgi:hypothetical protein
LYTDGRLMPVRRAYVVMVTNLFIYTV